ncbi:hypothetical protein DRO29_06250 [Candidatus Bathyarchaeota archaeon]|nr:MAG: hypothetical protein DRO29_06250 [Candidatus Bathyarchaeota archaeon]
MPSNTLETRFLSSSPTISQLLSQLLSIHHTFHIPLLSFLLLLLLFLLLLLSELLLLKSLLCLLLLLKESL